MRKVPKPSKRQIRKRRRARRHQLQRLRYLVGVWVDAEGEAAQPVT